MCGANEVVRLPYEAVLQHGLNPMPETDTKRTTHVYACLAQHAHTRTHTELMVAELHRHIQSIFV